MNDYHLINENISLTRDWTIKDWEDFRSNYDYWETRDRLISQKQYFAFKKFKNNALKAYIKKKKKKY
tara:strand:+ start:1832 stop:2032 length:201 start_codon:yes stop_codon:yes gene_type:complete